MLAHCTKATAGALTFDFNERISGDWYLRHLLEMHAIEVHPRTPTFCRQVDTCRCTHQHLAIAVIGQPHAILIHQFKTPGSFARRAFSAAWAVLPGPAHVSSVAQFLWAASLRYYVPGPYNYRGARTRPYRYRYCSHSLPLEFAGCRFATPSPSPRFCFTASLDARHAHARGDRFTECCTHGDIHGDTRSRHVQPAGHSLTDVQTPAHSKQSLISASRVILASTKFAIMTISCRQNPPKVLDATQLPS
jgi:hypothetical protein